MSKTTQIGKIGESLVLAKLTELGYQVFLPFGDGSIVDLIVDINGSLKKIQVKTSSVRENETCVKFSLSSTVNGVKYSYNEEDFDYYALVCLGINKILLIPLNSQTPKTQINFQLDKDTKNRFIDDYLIENILK